MCVGPGGATLLGGWVAEEGKTALGGRSGEKKDKDLEFWVLTWVKWV